MFNNPWIITSTCDAAKSSSRCICRDSTFSIFSDDTQVRLVKWLETKVTVLQWVSSWNPEKNILKMGDTDSVN